MKKIERINKAKKILKELEALEKFEVALFDSDTATAIVVEGGLSFKKAVNMAEKLWKTDNYYGVEVVSQDPDSIEPIQWIKTKSEFIESFGLNE